MSSSLLAEKMNVVVVDDDRIYRTFVVAMMSKSDRFHIFEAACSEELESLLQDGFVDCIILDYNLGNENGFAIQQDLKARLAHFPPIVMLTGDERQTTAIKALRLGIRDFLPKRNLKSDHLVAAVTAAVEQEQSDRRARAAHARLEASCGVDLVTGLPGMDYVRGRLAQLGDLTPPTRARHVVILVRIERFAALSQTFGLAARDQLMRRFAGQLKRHIRESDVCGGYGDGAFLIITEMAGDAGALAHVCDGLMERLSGRLELDALGIDLRVQVSARRCDDAEAFVGAPVPSEVARDIRDRIERRRTQPMTPSVETPPKPSLEPQKPSVTGEPTRSADRRREPRTRVLKRGHMILSSQGGTMDCSVRNISPSGAGLRLEAPVTVPGEFDLVIVGLEAGRRRVAVRWQNGCDLGVEYLD